MIAAGVALVLGVYGERIRRWVDRPVLRFGLSNGPPDCHMTHISLFEGGQEIRSDGCYYLRLRVHNYGRSSAHDVEVVLAEVAKFNDDDGQFHAWTEFLPMNLGWAHTGEVASPRISPGADVPRYCDLGRIVDPMERWAYGDDHDRIKVPREEAVLALSLSTRPNTGTFLLTRGVYRLKVVVAASNASIERREVRLEVTGLWSNHETEMRERGASIRFM